MLEQTETAQDDYFCWKPLTRHPGVIRVLEVLEETRTQMAIVTEPVVASLYNFLHKVCHVQPHRWRCCSQCSMTKVVQNTCIRDQLLISN